MSRNVQHNACFVLFSVIHTTGLSGLSLQNVTINICLRHPVPIFSYIFQGELTDKIQDACGPKHLTSIIEDGGGGGSPWGRPYRECTITGSSVSSPGAINEMFPLNTYMLKPKPPCDGTWRWGIWEVRKFR